jgi:drug/metabolite transporter (DMT)-like permease
VQFFCGPQGGVTISFLKSLPPFEVLFLSSLLIFLLTLPWIVFSIRKSDPDFSFKNCFLVFVGPPLQQILYVFAYQFAPAAEVDIIIYIWPILSLFLMALFLKLSLRLRHIIASFFGFGAILLLAYKGEAPMGLSIGHFLAFISALLWSIYSLLLQKGLKANIPTMGVAFGLGAFVTCPLHFYLEFFQLPTIHQCTVFLYYAIVLSLFSFWLWAKALKKGNGIFLTASAYSKPVLSILFLILFGYATYSNVLVSALCLILLSCFLSNDSMIFLFREILWRAYVKVFKRKQNLQMRF